MTKTQASIGVLLVILFASGIVIVELSDKVRLRVDEDKSTIYVPHSDYPWIWTVGGREYNRLFDGTSIMNRRTSDIKVDSWTTGPNFFIKRTTPYIRGPVIIDTYQFSTVLDTVELFPISHQVEVINATGYYYRYTVDELTGTGLKRKLTGQTLLSFGRNIKVELHPSYRWAWIGWPYGSDSLSAAYNLPSNYEVFNVRLFDPPSVNLTFDGVDTDRKYELQYVINVSATNVNNTVVCFNVDHPDYGTNYTCATGNHTFLLNISNLSVSLFTEGNTTWGIAASGGIANINLTNTSELASIAFNISKAHCC